MRRLTAAQKRHNKALYKRIRSLWERTDMSSTYKDYKKQLLGEAAGSDLPTKDFLKKKSKEITEEKIIRRAWEKSSKKITYDAFRGRVINYSEGTGKDIREAARHESETDSFKDQNQRGREHLLKSLKEDFRDTYDDLRQRIGFMDKGEHLADRLEWDQEKQMYKFRDRFGVDH